MPRIFSDPATARDDVLAWLHIGDLHLTTADAANRRDLDRIVALANGLAPGSLDFAFLRATTPTTARRSSTHCCTRPLPGCVFRCTSCRAITT